ncbi:ATP synthase F(0) complex subunit B1, mitochondrial [Hydra vulgaris]|uniref:ATP synthase subunit b n=1 Tax=Hydra vulgaris TaxID=6087 RepID=A0ABM4C0L9_HYDVU
MLSRLAVRQSAMMLQVFRPCVLSQHNFSLSTAKDKYSWHRTAWPAWQMYKDKAGSSGASIMIAGAAAYLISKEIMVVNDEFMLLILMSAVGYNLTKAVAGSVGKALDAERSTILESMNQGKYNQIASLKQVIDSHKEAKDALKYQEEFFDIIKANNEMKQEIAYRSNLHEVETEVKKRLDYQIDMQKLELSIEEQHVCSWVEQKVIASISPKQESDALNQCIIDLNLLAEGRAVSA